MPAEPWQPPDWAAAGGPLKVAGDYNFDPETEAWRYNALQRLDKVMQPPPIRTPPGANLYPQPSSPPDRVLPMGQAINDPMGNINDDPMSVIRSRLDPSRDPFLPLSNPMGGYPTPGRPRLDALALSPFTFGGGSATQPPAAATVAPEQRAMMQPDTTDVPGQAAPVFNSVNLSPLEQWPPPWWDFGGGSYGGGGFGGGFGGGYDFGAFA